MRRRAFIALIAGATAPWPLAARAEAARRLGLLFFASAQAAEAIGSLEAIVQGLKEHGWIEGQNITFEYRFADGKQDGTMGQEVGACVPQAAMRALHRRVG
jgi:putative ABC transport system substrate-binding protein